MRHRCFGRSISRKLAAAVMAVSLLAGQMLPVMAAEDAGASADDSQSVASSANDSAANDAASVKNKGASDTEKVENALKNAANLNDLILKKRSLSECAAGKSTLMRAAGMKTKPWNWTMEQLYLARIPWWRISRTGITRIMV